MKIGEIRKRAEEIGIQSKGLKKSELIHAIQEAEGNPPSFGNNDGECPYTDCCWWDDCISEFKKQKKKG